MRRFRSVAIWIILAGAISPVFSQSPAHGIKNVFWQPNELQQAMAELRDGTFIKTKKV